MKEKNKPAPLIALTMGDPAGIGPEVIVKALQNRSKDRFAYCVIGSRQVVHDYYSRWPLDVIDIDNPLQLAGAREGALFFFDPHDGCVNFMPGSPDLETGRVSLTYIDTALDWWRKGIVDALVTGPVSKKHINLSGTIFSGHTEYLARATGGSPRMLMFSPELSVLLVTTHLALDEIASAVTFELILEVIRDGARFMPRIFPEKGLLPLAVASRDPHAGDGGAISHFDDRVTARAVAAARGEGINVEGPFSADTLFLPEIRKRYSCCIVMYHDQGLIPFKMVAFEDGVNVTLGLPLVRTSVDHGTAFDIAGKDAASSISMTRALDLAGALIG